MPVDCRATTHQKSAEVTSAICTALQKNFIFKGISQDLLLEVGGWVGGWVHRVWRPKSRPSFTLCRAVPQTPQLVGLTHPPPAPRAPRGGLTLTPPL